MICFEGYIAKDLIVVSFRWFLSPRTPLGDNFQRVHHLGAYPRTLSLIFSLGEIFSLSHVPSGRFERFWACLLGLAKMAQFLKIRAGFFLQFSLQISL